MELNNKCIANKISVDRLNKRNIYLTYFVPYIGGDILPCFPVWGLCVVMLMNIYTQHNQGSSICPYTAKCVRDKYVLSVANFRCSFFTPHYKDLILIIIDSICQAFSQPGPKMQNQITGQERRSKLKCFTCNN